MGIFNMKFFGNKAKKYNASDYQIKATRWVKERKKSALWLDMGLGKTVITLTALSDLLSERKANKILIVAPLIVAKHQWSSEIKKWDHLCNLKYKTILGSKEDRIEALDSDADIFIINYDNIKWLIEFYGKDWPFDMLVLDESSKIKNPSSARFKALKKVSKHLDRVITLTGTPSPRSVLDLWSQIYMLDNGDRLGKTIFEFKNRFFKSDYMGYKFEFIAEKSEEFYLLLDDICLSMDADDYIKLPEKIIHPVMLDFNSKDRKDYDKLEKEMYVHFGDKKVVNSVTTAALMNKCLQFTNGAIYYDKDKSSDTEYKKVKVDSFDKNDNRFVCDCVCNFPKDVDKIENPTKDYILVHDEKLDKLQEIVEDIDSPILVAYNFISDAERIKERFDYAVQFDGNPEIINRWNRGEIKMLITHPQTAGYGINLQFGGNNIVWFGLTWDLELYQQFNARLHRQSQTKPVYIHQILMKDTIDEIVLASLNDKRVIQDIIMEAMEYSYKT